MAGYLASSRVNDETERERGKRKGRKRKGVKTDSWSERDRVREREIQRDRQIQQEGETDKKTVDSCVMSESLSLPHCH